MSSTAAPLATGVGDAAGLAHAVSSLPLHEPAGVTPDDLAHLRAALCRSSGDIMAAFRADTGYTRDDANELWDATLRFVDRLPALRSAAIEVARVESGTLASPGATLVRRPLGRILVCLPANAPLPLAVAVPLALLAGGNSVVIAASRAGRRTSLLVGRFLRDLAPRNVVLWEGRVRDVVEHLTEGRQVEAVYYMGSSGYFPTLAARCASAGVKLLYEGEGNSVAVVDEHNSRDDARQAADQLFAAKTRWAGRMCSAPNVIAVHTSRLDAFSEWYAQHCHAAPLAVDLASLASDAVQVELSAHLAAGTPTIPPVDRLCPRTPFLVRAVDLRLSLRRELFCPVAFLLPFDDWTALLSELRGVEHRLQVTLFSQDGDRAAQLVRSTRFARYCLNRDPVEQDPLLPWGNYGASGHSEVVDFFNKGLERAIVEGSADGWAG